MAGVSPGGEGQDFDLNIAPIIDCFTVLIAYLLISASFLSLGIFDVGVAASGEATAPSEQQLPKEPPMNLMIRVGAENLELKLTGGARNVDITIPVPSKDGTGPDLEGLKARLEDLKAKWPKLEDANVTADPAVQYREIVKVIEAVKPVFPKVFLAG